MNQLSLEVSDSLNPKVLRLIDTSLYADETLENYLLEVLPPQKSSWVVFHVQKYFSVATNSSNLGYKRVSDQAHLRDIPDGIYEVKLSYKPNIHTLVHFYHFRTVELQRKVRSQWDKLIGDTCKLSRAEFYKNRDRLREIEEYLMAAKWKVEECALKKEGKELYEWATKLLEQYTNECQC